MGQKTGVDISTHSKEECFVIYYKGKPLHVQPFETGWSGQKLSKKTYKKLYFTAGQAKNGIAMLPDEIDRNDLTIVQYTPSGGSVIKVDGKREKPYENATYETWKVNYYKDAPYAGCDV